MKPRLASTSSSIPPPVFARIHWKVVRVPWTVGESFSYCWIRLAMIDSDRFWTLRSRCRALCRKRSPAIITRFISSHQDFAECVEAQWTVRPLAIPGSDGPGDWCG